MLNMGSRKISQSIPQIGVLTSNKEEKVICEIDGRVLRGHAVWDAGAGAVLGCCLC